MPHRATVTRRAVGRCCGLLLSCGMLAPLTGCRAIHYLAVPHLFGARPRVTVDTTRGVRAVLVGAGDIALCGLAGDAATAALLDQIPGTVFTLGDNAYPDGSATDFANCYATTWGRHLARTRPAPGNHEYRDGRGAGYFAYFGARAGEPGKGYYSYDVGGWHAVSLNSNVDASVGSDQERWLRADLAAHPARCTLAYWHHPLFVSAGDSTPAVRPLWRALHEAGADVVLTGHHHAYERFARQAPDGASDPARGIRQFIVGTGGAGLDRLGRRARHSERRYDNGYGVLILRLFDDGYAWKFITVRGRVRDSGHERCH